MTRNYDRSYEKENSYEIDSFVLAKAKHSTNSELRKKLQQNLILIEKDAPNIVEIIEPIKSSDSACLPVLSKRENARRRGFDLKISNIDTINDKITGLLNMVKKDRQQNELKQTLRQQKNPNETDREISRSPNYNITSRWKRHQDSSNKKNNISREEPIVQKFNDLGLDRKKLLYEQEARNKIKTNDKNQEQQTLRSETIQTLRLKYLEENTKRDEDKMIDQNKNIKERREEQINTWWDQVLLEEKNKKNNFEEKIKGNNDDKVIINQEKRAIDEMIQKRRKERLKIRQRIRDISEDKVETRSKSAIRPTIEYQLPNKLINDSKRDSPITKVNQFEPKMEDHFVNIRTPISRKNSKEPQYNFSEMTYIEEDTGKQEKINCTAKLIDEQLMRIKSKINQSELNKKKIESFKSKNNENYKGKQHTMRIAQSISKQIKFDSHLKQGRQAFQKIPGENKWKELNAIAQEKGLLMDSRTIKELVTIGPDEHNPFGGEKSTVSIEELVTLLEAAEKNWENCVLKCASVKNLKNEGFQVSDLDLNNKGYLGPEDIVCFTNLYVNSFYRNRDLALVTRRLQLLQGYSKKGIEYDTFLEAFSV